MTIYHPTAKLHPFPLIYMFIIIHALAIAGVIIYAPTITLLGLAVAMYLIQSLGITLAFHRCLAHRSFTFRHKWLERIFVTIGTLALQRGPAWWCSIHRIHHRYSDTARDPHNSHQGFWYAHMLWFGHVDPNWEWSFHQNRYLKTVTDISNDPYYRWLDRYFYVPVLVLWSIFFLIGGWPWVFWGGFIATVVHWHLTWAVNSITHMSGYKNFMTVDTAVNNPLLALFSGGEGWHNNHHAFPSSPKHGFFKWWELDSTYLIILILKKMHLVDNLCYATAKQIAAAKLNPS